MLVVLGMGTEGPIAIVLFQQLGNMPCLPRRRRLVASNNKKRNLWSPVRVSRWGPRQAQWGSVSRGTPSSGLPWLQTPSRHRVPRSRAGNPVRVAPTLP